MPRISTLDPVDVAGASLVANSASDEAGLIATSTFALASDFDNVDNTSDADKPLSDDAIAALAGKQPIDQDLTDIAALSPTNNDFLQRKSGAWTNRTPTQATADLVAFVGDSGSGGTKGLVPAPTTGDGAKYLKGDGTWDTPAGGGGGDVAGDTHAASSKATPVDADEMPLVDSASSFGLKKLTWANLKATLKTYLDTLYQPIDDTLTAWAGYNTNGILTQTAADTFTGRTITGTTGQISVVNGNGVSGNPTIALPNDIIVPAVITVPNDGLHLLDTNASHDVIIKPGSNITADRTVTIVTGDADRTLDLTVGSGAMVQISKQVVSSPVSQVVFNNIPSSGYSKFVLVIIDAVSAIASTSESVRIHVSTDNGSTFKTTSGDYYTDTTATNNLVTINFPGATSTFQHGVATVELIGLGNSARATAGFVPWRVYAISATSVTTAVSDATLIRMRVAAEADNAFRIITGGGNNITAGTFILYGVTEA